MRRKKIVFVAIYVRKSRDNSESLESQLNAIVEYCIRRGWDYEIFMEEGSASSEDWNRPKLQLMIKKIESQHFDAVVVTEQSRITRADEFPKFRDILVEANCLFVTTDSGTIYDYTKPQDEFISDINSAVAKQELAWGKIRLRRGTIQSAKKGHWVGKKAPFGYDYDRKTKKLKKNQDAATVEEMFNLYLEGYSTQDIAHKFTQENRPGLLWAKASISRLLNNIAYAGHSLYGKTSQKKDRRTKRRVTKKTEEEEQILVKNTHDPIISPAKYEEAQRLMKLRKPTSVKVGKHAFSGLIRCGLCGAVHSFQRAHGKWRITSCQTRHYDGDTYTVCKNKGANLDGFEALVYQELAQYLKSFEEYGHIVEDSESREDALKSRERRIKSIESQLKKIQQGFILDIFTEEEAQAETRALKEQLEAIQAEEIPEENDTQDIIRRLQGLLQGDDMTEQEKNADLSEVLEAVVYTKTGKEMDVVLKYRTF